MSEKPIGESVGRQGADTGAAPETGVATGASEVVTKAKTETAETAVPGATAGAAEPEDPIHGLKSALGKERERGNRFEKDWKSSERARKQLEQRLAVIEQQHREAQAAAAKVDPKELADRFFAGPETFVTGQVSESEKRIMRAVIEDRIESSKEMARDRYDDFDDVESVFLEAAAKDKSLWEGIEQARLPALLVYKRGKKLLETAAQGGSAKTADEDRIAKLEARIEQLTAGRDGGQTGAEAETAEAAAKKPTVPRSTVGTRGTGVGSTTSFRGPSPMESAYGNHRRRRRAQG